jgi:hypothetical protein
MSHLHRTAAAGLTAIALLVTVVATDAGAQEPQRRAPRQADQPRNVQSIQIAPAPAGGAAGGFTTAPAPIGTPTLAQMGASSAYVPMKHATTGIDAGNHVLAVQNGNLNMKFKAGMTCPEGLTVIHVSARPVGVNTTTFVGSDTGSDTYSATVTLKPFTKSELETACQQALGGGWASSNGHNNTTQTVKKTISKKIDVWGQCSGWTNKAKRTYTALLTLTCDDTSWFTPEG